MRYRIYQEVTCHVVMQAVVAHRFSMLLLALTQRCNSDLGTDFVVHLALAACHPVVMLAERSRHARPLWSRVRRRLTSAPTALAGEQTCHGATGQACSMWGNGVHALLLSHYPRSVGKLISWWCCAAHPDTAVGTLLSKQGTGSSSPLQQQAGLAALRTCMAEAPDALFPPVYAWLEAQLRRSHHDALSASDIAKWAAPVGMLAAEVGAQNGFVAEVVEDKNVRKVASAGFKQRLRRCDVAHVASQPRL
jgi:hypothetical protein